MRRVVVTGLGLVTPLGVGVEAVWRRLVAGESGIGPITLFDAGDLPCRIAGEVPAGGKAEAKFDAAEHIPAKEIKKMDRFIQFAMAAAEEALADSGYKPETDEQHYRAGVMVGSGIGGLPEIEATAITLHERGWKKVSPFFIPATLANLASGQISIAHHLKGPNHAVVTACSTGAHAIGDASRLIQLGDADVMVAGGAESAICNLGIAGFSAARALSTKYNDTPGEASRPFDKGRDGFVMGEGAGIVVLEELEHAKARGAKIYAEVIGYGLSGDAHHITAPAPGHDGAYRAMRAALQRAGIGVEAIDYINAHGTSTPLGDELEVGAVKRLLGDAAGQVTLSSTKSAIGHLLGAAGAVEAIFCVLALRDQVAPPTLNLHDIDEACLGIDLAPLTARERSIKIALSNSFGFGGTNASLILRQGAL